MIPSKNPVLSAIEEEDVNELNQLLKVPKTLDDFLQFMKDPNNVNAISSACYSGEHTKKFGVINALCQKISSLQIKEPIPGNLGCWTKATLG